MNKMIIRKAKKNDAKGVAKVLMGGYKIDSLKEGDEVFKEEISKKINYIVAVENNKILGIATWFVHGLPKHGLAELDRIAVLRDAREKGLGKKLFNALIDDIKKYYKSRGSKLRKLFLLTHKSNTNAQEFYKKLGFKHETTLKGHFHKGEDEYVFSIFFNT